MLATVCCIAPSGWCGSRRSPREHRSRPRSKRRTCFFFKSWMSHHLDVKPRNAFSAAGVGAARRGMEAEAVCVPGRAVGEHADCVGPGL